MGGGWVAGGVGGWGLGWWGLGVREWPDAPFAPGHLSARGVPISAQKVQNTGAYGPRPRRICIGEIRGI